MDRLLSFLGATLLLISFNSLAGIPPKKIKLKNSYEENVFIDFTAAKEFGGDFENGITMWNDGEEFPSLGLGHYIWFPKLENQDVPFVESFPKLLQYIHIKDPELNLYVAPIIGELIKVDATDKLTLSHAPWSSKEDFYADSRRLDLNVFLSSQKMLKYQAHYQVSQYNGFLKKLIESYVVSDRDRVTSFINTLVTSIKGKVAIIDYTNFKGSGLNIRERYKGQGWGLKQVLKRAISYPTSISSIDRFAAAAKWSLDRRIQNSPPERGEHRWRRGWFKRIDEYRSIGQK